MRGLFASIFQRRSPNALTLACGLTSASLALFIFANHSLAMETHSAFDEQLNNQNEKLNTGLLYWIELLRQGQTLHVTNKERFISGDKIRFHIQSNIDGYAYIVLLSGSQGERSVLFPLAKSKDSNRILHGKDYALPEDDYLTFDQNPGVEKVCLLISRNVIDPEILLKQPSEESHVVLTSQPGSKDLVPAKIRVVYSPKQSATNQEHPTSEPKLTAAKNSDKAAQTNGAVIVVHDDPDSMLQVDVDLTHAG